MEEMLSKFIDEKKQEHEEMEIFIREFKTTNELLLKEQNNLLSELGIEVHGLSRVMNDVLILKNKVKGVITRGKRMKTGIAYNDEINNTNEEPSELPHDKSEEPRDSILRNEPQKTKETVSQPSVEVQVPSIPFPNRLRKKRSPTTKVFGKSKTTHINLPFIEAIIQMPKYAKFLKSLLTNKSRLEEACTVTMNARCSAVTNCHPRKKTQGLGLGKPKHTRICLELADRSIQYPRGIVENVLIKVNKFVLPIDFVILDMLEDSRIPIILGRPFLATARAMIDVFNKKIMLRLDDTIHKETQDLLEKDQSDLFLLKDLEKGVNQLDQDNCSPKRDKIIYDFIIRGIDSIDMAYSGEQQNDSPDNIRSEHLYSASASEIENKRPKLKTLPSHLEYSYLNGNESFPIIISSKHSKKEKKYFVGFFQIPIAPEDQEKTMFTCPYGTFAYRRMPFGLCNALATFQRCMTPIFHDLVEEFMEVFMDYFLVFGNSFDNCLVNLEKMLARCEDTNLVLNWKKCYFMVREGIVLGHKIYRSGIEVDKAKIDVIAKLPYPTNVKGARSFLGHAGFTVDDCKKTFNILKEKLTTAPIIISPDWNFPFELMCDASDFAIGAVFGQRIDGKFKPIFYASKTLNNAQENYTTTKNELLPVIFAFDKFCPYFVLSMTIVYTDHSTLKYLFNKQDGMMIVFDVWGLDFMGPFPNSRGNTYILVAVDYVSKWVKAQALPTNDARVVFRFLRGLFARFGVPKALISDRGTDFCNSQLEKALEKYGVTHRTAYKTPTGCTPFRMVYGKACHLPVEIEHKAHWPLKQCNMDLSLASKSRLMQLNELAESRDGAYENTIIYKQQTKKWHDSRLHGDKNLKVGKKVLLYNSCLKMYPGKLKSKWSGPNTVKTIYPYGAIEITDRNGFSFKLDGQRLKKYYKTNIDKGNDDVIDFENGIT
ncbi:reverse transcriptase domain-containing protein [Tanacetum coccineum]